MELPPGKKLYFVSDLHLGYPNARESRQREKIFLQWLDSIEKDAHALFLLGDIFDFWFDYKHAVPKNFVRMLGKLARMSDQGIEIYFFYGNHDMWIKDYFKEETGMKIIPDDLLLDINHTLYTYMAHGDGLGPGDRSYKWLKKLFRSKTAQFFYRWLHPDLGIPLAGFFSRLSRSSENPDIKKFMGAEKEHLIIHSKKLMKNLPKPVYFIYGHRHHVIEYPIDNQAVYINIGDWIEHYTYAECDGQKITLKKFEPEKPRP